MRTAEPAIPPPEAQTPRWDGDGIKAQFVLGFCRTLPEFRGKGTLYRWLARLLFGGELPVRGQHGARFRIDAGDFIGRAIAYTGNYEARSISRAMAIMDNGGVFLDIGCNVGLYTISVGTIPQTKVIAIDGSFMALSQLFKNIQQNPGIDVNIVSCALGSADTLSCFELPVVGNLGTMRVRDANATDNTFHFWVATRGLQAVLSELAPAGIQLLKIDVEGSELSVFKTFDFHSTFRPANIIMEFDAEFPAALECFDFLVSSGYEPLTVHGAPMGRTDDPPEKNVWFRSITPAGQ